MSVSEEQRQIIANVVREVILPEFSQGMERSFDGRLATMNQTVMSVAERVRLLEEKITTMTPGRANSIRDKMKEARDYKPKEWSGEKSYPFSRLGKCVRNWGSVLNSKFDQILNVAESHEYLDDDKFDKVKEYCTMEDFLELKRALGRLLIDTCAGEAQAFVDVPDRNGFQAWKQLTDHYDPRGGVDRGRAYTRITQPQMTTKRAKDAGKAMQMLKSWENELYMYIAKFGEQISDTAKITAIKAIMPEDMFGSKGAFRGRVYTTYESIRRDIMHFLEDRPPTEAVDMEIGAMDNQGDMVDDATNMKSEEIDSKTNADMINTIYAAMFGGPYVKGKGKGGDVPGWSNWQGKGKSGYYPYNAWVSNSTWAKASHKGEKGEKGEKGDKGKGKGKGKPCWRCGLPGHFARECYTNLEAKGKGKGGGLYEMSPMEDEWKEVDRQEEYYPDFLAALAEEDFPKVGDEDWKVMSARRNKKRRNRKIGMVSFCKDECGDACACSKVGQATSGQDDATTLLILSEGRKPTPAFNMNEKKVTWKKIEAAVDSGAVDIVGNPVDFPGIEVEQTDESKNGDYWVGPGGEHVAKEGVMKVNWETNGGVKKRLMVKAGRVGKTLISADKLCEGGYEVRLTKRSPKLIHEKTGETIPLRRTKGMFILDMWIKVPNADNSTAHRVERMDVGTMSGPGFIRQGW